MINNIYLSSSVLTDNSIHTLLIKPYKEGFINVKEVVKPSTPTRTLKDLAMRISRIFVGIALIIPIINTVVLLALRLLNTATAPLPTPSSKTTARTNTPSTNINLHPSPSTSNGTKTSQSQPISEKEKAEIEFFVRSFLFSYTSGRVTRENEPKDRKSLMELLSIHLEKKFPKSNFNKKEVEKIALTAYLMFAGETFSTNILSRLNKTNPPKNKVLEVKTAFYQAVRSAIQKDFPYTNFMDKEITQKCEAALKYGAGNSELIELEKEDEPIPTLSERRELILEALNKKENKSQPLSQVEMIPILQDLIQKENKLKNPDQQQIKNWENEIELIKKQKQRKTGTPIDSIQNKNRKVKVTFKGKDQPILNPKKYTWK